MLFSNLFSGHGSSSTRKRNNNLQPRYAHRRSTCCLSYAPRLELLENRHLLSAISVLNTADSGPGSLRAAVAVANAAPDADVIEFAPSARGTIHLTSGELAITEELTINGLGQDALTISGSDSSRIFNVTGAAVDINHLTIRDGRAAPAGGGILNNGGTLRLNYVAMRDNAAIDAAFGGGGAIFNRLGTLNVHSSFFVNNWAIDTEPGTTSPVSGGAIANALGSVDLSDSTFLNNGVDSGDSIGIGGAVSNSLFGTLSVSHSQFVGNSVRSDVEARGGAIWSNFFSTVTVDRSSIVHNSAVGPDARGGGIYNGAVGASFTLSRSNVNANRAIGHSGDAIGGGVYNEGALAIDQASNIRGNMASTSDDDVFGCPELL